MAWNVSPGRRLLAGIGLAVVLLAAAWHGLSHAWTFSGATTTIEGKVVEVRFEGCPTLLSTCGKIYNLRALHTIRYRTRDGSTHEHVYVRAVRHKRPVFAVGRTVPVTYRVDAPDTAFIGDVDGRGHENNKVWIGLVALLVIVVGALGLYVHLWLLARAKASAAPAATRPGFRSDANRAAASR